MSYDISSFVPALINIFASLNRLEARPRSVDQVLLDKVMADFSAELAIHNGGSGRVVITFEAASAQKLARHLVGETELADNQIADVIGEVLNMIVGQAQRFCDHRFRFTVPVTATGPKHEVRSLVGAPSQRVIADFDGSSMELYLITESAA